MKTGVILARFQPVHNGHMALIEKAYNENDNVLVIIGSSDKLSERNPIPCNIRKELVENAVNERNLGDKVRIVELDDLTDEHDNSMSWGFYLYSFIVSIIKDDSFTIYYSDGYEIICSWFPGHVLRNHVSLSLMARNTCVEGISATKIREMICNGTLSREHVPSSVYENMKTLKSFIEIQKKR